MPLYDYNCVSCGDFREIRPMAESSKSRECPTCGAPSERVLSTPFLAGTNSGSGMSHPGGGPFGFRHACGHGCSHSHGA